ncbi:hypothetical protein Ancab_006704 [Ancistrocladus abbreviatus]
MAPNSSSENLSASATTAAVTTAPIPALTSTSTATTTTATANISHSTTITTATARPVVVSPQQVQPQPRASSTLQFIQHHQRHQFHPQFNSQQGVFAASSQRPQLMAKPPTVPVQEAIRYPVASSGRGCISRAARPGQLPDQTVTIAANPGGVGSYPPPRSTMLGYPPPPPPPPQTMAQNVRGLGYGPSLDSIHLIRPPNLRPSHMVPLSNPSIAVKGIPFPVLPHSKVAASQGSVPDCNGHKEPSDKGRDDTFVIVRDRKVRISDGASIYALCRSWLKNGFCEESQPQFGDIVKSLPKPLPAPTSDTRSPKREGDSEEEEEDQKSAENLSSEELLQRHIKHAKRVRARLREERLQRIARYKGRLALLLPPLVEQCRNDASTGT